MKLFSQVIAHAQHFEWETELAPLFHGMPLVLERMSDKLSLFRFGRLIANFFNRQELNQLFQGKSLTDLLPIINSWSSYQKKNQILQVSGFVTWQCYSKHCSPFKSNLIQVGFLIVQPKQHARRGWVHTGMRESVISQGHQTTVRIIKGINNTHG